MYARMYRQMCIRDRGYCSDKLSYYPNGELFCEEKYTYYDDGNEKSYWCKYESMLFSTAIEYDTEGRKTKIDVYKRQPQMNGTLSWCLIHPVVCQELLWKKPKERQQSL